MSAVSQHQMNESDLGKDANVLIMELNKGLQSPNLGEQCKAIAQFPNLLEKYPFPMVVNSIFLKIAQIFCDGLFGTLSRITSEHIGVHHAILKQIDSHYEVESDAAIWSSHQLASMSRLTVRVIQLACKLLVLLANSQPSEMDGSVCGLGLGEFVTLVITHFLIPKENRSCPAPWFLSSDELSEDDMKLTYSLLVQLFSCFPNYASCLHEMDLWRLVTLGKSLASST
ncbi:unnamed protein product [Echinostoma caproni]|uniref:Huntingtin n=1 Tax=Echinostoma caproni TaxID=27848 RepID=A0A183AXD2_9TREM|nr:unnamed protein product [Echinostoma caproni]